MLIYNFSFTTATNNHSQPLVKKCSVKVAFFGTAGMVRNGTIYGKLLQALLKYDNTEKYEKAQLN